MILSGMNEEAMTVTDVLAQGFALYGITANRPTFTECLLEFWIGRL